MRDFLGESEMTLEFARLENPLKFSHQFTRNITAVASKPISCH